MKSAFHGLIAAFGLLAAAPGHAGAQEPAPGRFDRILERNPFALQQEAPPPEIPAAPYELPAIRLTGVVRFGTIKQALVVIEERGRPDRCVGLREGQEANDLEILRISAEAGIVLARFHGRDLLLSFDAQAREELEARLAEERFIDEHTRAHEENERREREREQRERAEGANARQQEQAPVENNARSNETPDK
jgi:hypothetical protein